MADPILVELTKLAHDAILAAKRGAEYSFNDFELQRSYYPKGKLADLPEAGRVWVIGLAGDDDNQARSNAFTRMLAVQIGIQLPIPGDPAEETSNIDRFVGLEDEIRDTVRNLSHQHFAWNRTEALKDENGTPFYFQAMRERNIFEAYFTAYFKVGLR